MNRRPCRRRESFSANSGRSGCRRYRVRLSFLSFDIAFSIPLACWCYFPLVLSELIDIAEERKANVCRDLS